MINGWKGGGPRNRLVREERRWRRKGLFRRRRSRTWQVALGLALALIALGVAYLFLSTHGTLIFRRLFG